VKNAVDTKVIFRIVEGSHLLASDIQTGKSDPVCFVWVGPNDEIPNLEVPIDARLDEGIMLTSVCPCTVDPRWDEEIAFPLECDSLQQLVDMRCLIYVRDEDINEDESITYDELGMLEIPFKDIIEKGKKIQGNSFVLSAAWYSLKKSPGMRKAEGDIKMCCSLIFGNNDTTKSLFGQLNTLKENKSDTLSTPPATMSEFTEQLHTIIKPPSRPNSALRSRPNSAGSDNASVASSRRLGSSMRSKGDGLAKKQVAKVKKRTGTGPLGISLPLGGNGSAGNNNNAGDQSVISNIHQDDMESVFGGEELAGSPNYDGQRYQTEYMDPIMENADSEMFNMDGAEQNFDPEEGVSATVKNAPVDLGETGESELVIIKSPSPGHEGEGNAPPSQDGENLESTAEWLAQVDGNGEALTGPADPAVLPKPEAPDSLSLGPSSAGGEKAPDGPFLAAFEKNLSAAGANKENQDGAQKPQPPVRARSKPELLPELGSMLGVPQGGDQALPPPEDNKPLSRRNSGERQPQAQLQPRAPVTKEVSCEPVAPMRAQTTPLQMVPRSHTAPSQSTMSDSRDSRSMVRSVDRQVTQSPSGGSGGAAARMLKELSIQRQIFQKGLEQLTELTQKSIGVLSERIDKLEGGGISAASAKGVRLLENTAEEPAGDLAETVSKKQTANSIRNKAPARNVRLPPGSFKQFKNRTNQRLDEAERCINTSPDRGRAYVGSGNGSNVPNDDYIKSSTTPARLQREINQNRFDPRYHDNVPEVGGGTGLSNLKSTAPSFQNQIENQRPNQNQNQNQGGYGSSGGGYASSGNYNGQQQGNQNSPGQVQQNVANDANNNMLSQSLDWRNIEQSAQQVNQAQTQEQLQPQDQDQIHNMFEQVLNRGSHDDFIKLLKTFGPKPEVLSKKNYSINFVRLCNWHLTRFVSILCHYIYRYCHSACAVGLLMQSQRSSCRAKVRSVVSCGCWHWCAVSLWLR